MSAYVRNIFASAVLCVFAGTAVAQECPAEPSFVGVTSTNANVRASKSRIDRGQWAIAEHFATEAIESGTASRNKAAAYINLCAALANQLSAGTVEACDEAVNRNESRWEAYNNRGAAYWLAGDQAAAIEDFGRASELGAGEEEVETNAALARCEA